MVSLEYIDSAKIQKIKTFYFYAFVAVFNSYDFYEKLAFNVLNFLLFSCVIFAAINFLVCFQIYKIFQINWCVSVI